MKMSFPPAFAGVNLSPQRRETGIQKGLSLIIILRIAQFSLKLIEERFCLERSDPPTSILKVSFKSPWLYKHGRGQPGVEWSQPRGHREGCYWSGCLDLILSIQTIRGLFVRGPTIHS